MNSDDCMDSFVCPCCGYLYPAWHMKITPCVIFMPCQAPCENIVIVNAKFWDYNKAKAKAGYL